MMMHDDCNDAWEHAVLPGGLYVLESPARALREHLIGGGGGSGGGLVGVLNRGFFDESFTVQEQVDRLVKAVIAGAGEVVALAKWGVNAGQICIAPDVVLVDWHGPRTFLV